MGSSTKSKRKASISSAHSKRKENIKFEDHDDTFDCITPLEPLDNLTFSDSLFGQTMMSVNYEDMRLEFIPEKNVVVPNFPKNNNNNSKIITNHQNNLNEVKPAHQTECAQSKGVKSISPQKPITRTHTKKTNDSFPQVDFPTPMVEMSDVSDEESTDEDNDRMLDIQARVYWEEFERQSYKQQQITRAHHTSLLPPPSEKEIQQQKEKEDFCSKNIWEPLSRDQTKSFHQAPDFQGALSFEKTTRETVQVPSFKLASLAPNECYNNSITKNFVKRWKAGRITSEWQSPDIPLYLHTQKKKTHIFSPLSGIAKKDSRTDSISSPSLSSPSSSRRRTPPSRYDGSQNGATSAEGSLVQSSDFFKSRSRFAMAEEAQQHFDNLQWFDEEKSFFIRLLIGVGKDYEKISDLMGGTKSKTQVKSLFYAMRSNQLASILFLNPETEKQKQTRVATKKKRKQKTGKKSKAEPSDSSSGLISLNSSQDSDSEDCFGGYRDSDYFNERNLLNLMIESSRKRMPMPTQSGSLPSSQPELRQIFQTIASKIRADQSPFAVYPYFLNNHESQEDALKRALLLEIQALYRAKCEAVSQEHQSNIQSTKHTKTILNKLKNLITRMDQFRVLLFHSAENFITEDLNWVHSKVELDSPKKKKR